MRVKICGITRVEDARCAEAAGADAVGFIFVPASKRFVTPAQAAALSAALGPFIQRVGVFVDSPLKEVLAVAKKLRLHAIQLHGSEDAAYAAAVRQDFFVIKVWSFQPDLSLDVLKAFPADAIFLDGLKPGSGESFDWTQAAFLKGLPNLILAGGLNPDNVAEGIAVFKPYAVDVSSGVELQPGIKDPNKVQDFVRRAKSTQLSTVIHSYPQACG
ncbi:phosphoribosylanthranilate isomerase [soil metagenome]